MNAHVPPPPSPRPRRPLTPREEAIVREFRAALVAARELETEKMYFALHKLNMYCDGIDRLQREHIASVRNSGHFGDQDTG